MNPTPRPEKALDRWANTTLDNFIRSCEEEALPTTLTPERHHHITAYIAFFNSHTKRHAPLPAHLDDTIHNLYPPSRAQILTPPKKTAGSYYTIHQSYDEAHLACLDYLDHGPETLRSNIAHFTHIFTKILEDQQKTQHITNPFNIGTFHLTTTHPEPEGGTTLYTFTASTLWTTMKRNIRKLLIEHMRAQGLDNFDLPTAIQQLYRYFLPTPHHYRLFDMDLYTFSDDSLQELVQQNPASHKKNNKLVKILMERALMKTMQETILTHLYPPYSNPQPPHLTSPE